MKKLIVFDGNSILNRAFYGIRPLTTKDGLHTNAVYGFLNIIKKHLDAFKPDGAVCAFDLKAPTFRHKRYEGYKAARKGMPEELAMQLPYAKEAVSLLGIKIFEKEGFEADDILGTLARQAEENETKCRIVTGDRDSLQLVSEYTSVNIASTGKDDLFTPREIYEKYGVEPKKLIDIKSLMGDTSDNIPGVSGIGEKTAVKLVFEYGTLDEIYEKIDEIGVSASVKEKLKNGKDSAYMSRELAEIYTYVPDVDITNAEMAEIDREKLTELFTKLEFQRLIKTFGLDEPTMEQMQEKLIKEITSYKKASSSKRKKIPEDTLQITIDEIEPDESEEELCEVSAEAVNDAAAKGICAFVDFRNNSDAVLSLDGVFYKVSDKASCELLKKLPIVVYDKKEFLGYLEERYSVENDDFNVCFDLKLAQYLINPADSATTRTRLVFLYLKRSYGELIESDERLSVSVMEELYKCLSEEIEKNGLSDLYYKVELPLARVLASMEETGFSVSKDGLIGYAAKLEKRIAETEEEIYALSGEKFNINSPKQLGEMLFEKMGLPGPKKKKNGYPTDAETLEQYRASSPIFDLVLEYRGLTKLYSTYAVGLRKVISPKDGRIHTSFNQYLTLTGRLSSAEPNLQNIPTRTELGRELRGFFVPGDKGSVLIDADYSQIELRVLAYLSGDETMVNAFETGEDIHIRTASNIFGVPAQYVTPEMRSSAKTVNFSIIYGIGDFSLAKDIGVSVAEAKTYIQTYFKKYPKVKEYLDFLIEDAKEKGYSKTMFGRIRYVPELKATNKNIVSFGKRVAMNTPIQGSAADIIKIAMVKTDERLRREKLSSRLILQVHDELIIEAPANEAEYVSTLLKNEMEGVTDKIRLVADVGTGGTWLHAKT